MCKKSWELVYRDMCVEGEYPTTNGGFYPEA